MHNLTDTQRTPLSTCYSWHHDWLVPPRPLVLSTDGWNDPRWLNPTAVLLRETKLRLLTKDVGLDVYAEEQWKAAYASGDYSKVARLLRVLAE
jgi:hypothetical protein